MCHWHLLWLVPHCTDDCFRPTASICVAVRQAIVLEQIISSCAVVESSISGSTEMAKFMAASSPHSVDWLLAFPVSSCVLNITDAAVHMAVSLCLGCSVCMPYTCRSGALVGLTCKQVPSKAVRHNAINDTIACTLKNH